jgi:transposase InsO family protein
MPTKLPAIVKEFAENVESYIYFYNYKRIHSVIGYITPAQKMAELKIFQISPYFFIKT